MSVLLPLLVSRTNDMEKCLMSTGSDREKYVLFYSCVSIGKSFAHVRYTLAVNSNLILLTYANPLQYCFQLSPNACKTFKSKEFLVLNFGLVGSRNMDPWTTLEWVDDLPKWVGFRQPIATYKK